MNKFEKRIKENLEKAKIIYNPKTAFGNEQLLFYTRNLEVLAIQQEIAKNCNICDEDGYIKENCFNCDGTGLETIQCEHK